MRKVLQIIKREYLSRVMRKSFLVTTLLAPIGFILLIFSSYFISQLSDSKKVFAIVDESGLFRETVFPDAPDGKVFFKKSEHEPVPGEESGYDGVIIIPGSFDVSNPNRVKIRLLSDQRLGMVSREFIRNTLHEEINNRKLELLHLDPATIEQLGEKIELNFEVTGLGKEKTGFTEVALIIGYVMGFAIYIALFVYGTMIMKGVMEEKTNRIVEVLISSVKPFQLMIGKIIGVGAVGLTQFFLWIVLIFISNLGVGLILGSAAGNNPSMPGQPADIDQEEIQMILSNLSDLHFAPILLVFIVFFLLGFLMYGALFAAIGSAAGDDGDLQSLTFPVSIPIVVSMIVMMNALSEPESPLAFWASIIPFSSPLIMPALMPFNPPWWQVLLSLVMLIGMLLLNVYIAAKIYRTGILLYGKKVTFKEIIRWVTAKG